MATNHIDLASFRLAVDNCSAGITSCQGDLRELYQYVGLPQGSSFTINAVSNELYKKIKSAFVSGHQSVWRQCKKLRKGLIQDYVIDDKPLEPYFSILERLQDAIRTNGPSQDEIQGDWNEAIRHAYDHASFQNWGMSDVTRERVNQRYFEVAKAAKRIQANGYRLNRNNGDIFLEPESEKKLVMELERLIVAMGGVNVARRIFQQISPLYDIVQERYHLVRQVFSTGGGSPQAPFGYLLLLAAKHPIGKKPLKNTEENWQRLLRLATDYAAVLDVQSYTPSAWESMDAIALLPYLQELAVHDTLFCIHQVRGQDIVNLARGVLDGLDFLGFDDRYGSGWTVNEVLAVVASLLDISRDHRGPICIDQRTIKRVCSHLAPEAISRVLKEVLSHPISGANQHFLKPTDAPVRGTSGLEYSGHDFFKRPLLTYEHGYLLLDRAMCAPACLEALFTPLREIYKKKYKKKFDDHLGPTIERFLRTEFARHSIPTLTGSYHANGKDGECDLVIETSQAIILLETKRKSLTRLARAGSDAQVLLDLAKSLLKAQVQMGWLELLLRQNEFIDLEDKGIRTRLQLKGRQVERIAVTLLDFGSFQDRILLKQFLEGNLNAQYSVSDITLQKSFIELNELLADLRQQVGFLAQEKEEIAQPFFHCWFLSIPQLLILLDGVQGADAFKEALWLTRHTTTSSLDFYFDFAYMKKLKAKAHSNGATTN